MWQHVTNHLIISNDKGLQHRKNRISYTSVTLGAGCYQWTVMLLFGAEGACMGDATLDLQNAVVLPFSMQGPQWSRGCNQTGWSIANVNKMHTSLKATCAIFPFLWGGNASYISICGWLSGWSCLPQVLTLACGVSSSSATPGAKSWLFSNSDSGNSTLIFLPLWEVDGLAEAGDQLSWARQALEVAGAFPFPLPLLSHAQVVGLEGLEGLDHPSRLANDVSGFSGVSDVWMMQSVLWCTICSQISQKRGGKAPPILCWGNLLQIVQKILIAEVGVPGLVFTYLLPAELENVLNGDYWPVDGVLFILYTIYLPPNSWIVWWGHAFCIIVIHNINDMLNGSIMSDIVHAEWWEIMGMYQFLPHLHVPILHIMLRLGQLDWVLLCNIQQFGCNDEQCCLICNQRKVTVWKHGIALGGRAEWAIGQWRKPFIQLYPVTSRLLGDSCASHTYNIWISCAMNGPPTSQSTLPWIKGKGLVTDRHIKYVVAVDVMGCGGASCIHKTTQNIY